MLYWATAEPARARRRARVPRRRTRFPAGRARRATRRPRRTPVPLPRPPRDWARKDRAQHTHVTRREERRLPSQADPSRTIAAQAQALTPGEQRLEIRRRSREHHAHLGLRFAI